MSVRIWHNPRCSKSRQTLQLLQDRGIDPEVVDYKNNAPTIDEIKRVIAMLNIEPIDLMRTGETKFKELKLTKDTDGQVLVSAMNAHPILIERPVVINGNEARIGRPPETVLELF